MGMKAFVHKKESPSITPSIEDPYARVRAAQQEVRQQVASLSPVLKHRPELKPRGGSKQRARQSVAGTLDVKESQHGSKDKRVAYRGQSSPVHS